MALTVLLLSSLIVGAGLQLQTARQLTEVEQTADRVAAIVHTVAEAPAEARLEVDQAAARLHGIPSTLRGSAYVLRFTSNTVTVDAQGMRSTASWGTEVRLGPPLDDQGLPPPALQGLTVPSGAPWVVHKLAAADGAGPAGAHVVHLYHTG